MQRSPSRVMTVGVVVLFLLVGVIPGPQSGGKAHSGSIPGRGSPHRLASISAELVLQIR